MVPFQLMSQEFVCFLQYVVLIFLKMIVLSPFVGYINIVRNEGARKGKTPVRNEMDANAVRRIIRVLEYTPLVLFTNLAYEAYGLMEGQKDKGHVSVHSNETMERIWRCFMDDVVNILPFSVLGFLYAQYTYAPLTVVRWHCCLFLGSRLLHICIYFNFLTRFIYPTSAFLSFCINLSMAVQTFICTLQM